MPRIPGAGFLPQTGRILRWRPATGLRVDHALAEGQAVSADYDPMLAKLVAHGPDRETARRRLIAGLEATELLGLRTNRAWLIDILRQPDFVAGRATTDLLERLEPASDPAPDPLELALAVFLFAARAGGASDPAHPRFGWTNGPRPWLRRRLDVDGTVHPVALRLGPGPRVTVEDGREAAVTGWRDGHLAWLTEGRQHALPFAFDGDALHLGPWQFRDATHRTHRAARADEGARDGRLLAPMAGTVISVAVEPGARVARGEVLAVLEAMKMEHPLRAPCAGRVEGLAVRPGMQLAARALVAEIAAEIGDDE
jgi:geranyl-CoA carboxylase alpha subunit